MFMETNIGLYLALISSLLHPKRYFESYVISTEPLSFHETNIDYIETKIQLLYINSIKISQMKTIDRLNGGI